MEALKATVQPLADKDKKESPFSKWLSFYIGYSFIVYE